MCFLSMPSAALWAEIMNVPLSPLPPHGPKVAARKGCKICSALLPGKGSGGLNLAYSLPCEHSSKSPCESMSTGKPAGKKSVSTGKTAQLGEVLVTRA